VPNGLRWTGENPISFCNGSSLARLSLPGGDAAWRGRQLGLDLARLRPSDRRLLAVDCLPGVVSCAGVAYYFALSSLSE